jgi:hypothetical protein
MGSLLAARKTFIASGGNPAALPIPQWVKDFEADLLEEI